MRRAANWYACADRGGRWPMMLGPYDEERARGEARNYPGGFAVGFATSADRGDFLRRWEDADAAGRAAIVARLSGPATVADGGLPHAGGLVQHVGAVGCADCERGYGPGALCRCEVERCSSCGEWGCEGDCEQGADDAPACEGCPGGCLECRELDMRDMRSDEELAEAEARAVWGRA